MHETTIVAQATPEGSGGLAVLRLSGPDALAIAGRVFTARRFGPGRPSHRAVYGILHTPNDVTTDDYEIDRCLALTLLGPASYTGEDTVEFQCHGGPAVVRRALAACRQAGAEPASAGDFTRRAFLNGRLTLDQAEAVADLVGAGSDQAARAALRQLRGGLDDQLRQLEQPLLELLARLEGSFEFLDEEEVDVPSAEAAGIVRAASARMDELLAMAPAGRLLRDGVQVVLVGPPNVGKSSLFNALVGDERAIVDEEPGTTRDVVSARVEHDGLTYVFHDTAGLREEGGRIEHKGMDRTRREAAGADVMLALRDVSRPGSGGLLPADVRAPVLVVGTKADLGETSTTVDVITSSVDGRGLDELWSLLTETVRDRRVDQAVAMGVVLNERHRGRLVQCRDDLAELSGMLTADPPAGTEVTGTVLASILGRLGEISGRVFTEHLLETIFNKFCIGK
ncbi:MAG: tRNA uridine-5-carboxymethylaminomethyl(34) synthesis GTPase MnmE [bacterium]|nr:tRNA uridine-5-carboxymethylaminomethyl(34) synthesis GTPase MnmE [bacterium]